MLEDSNVENSDDKEQHDDDIMTPIIMSEDLILENNDIKEEQDVFVYDSDGNKVEVKFRTAIENRKSSTYYEDKKRRTNARSDQRKGFLKKMVSYKTTTGDDIMIRFRKDDGYGQIKEYSTDLTMFINDTPTFVETPRKKPRLETIEFLISTGGTQQIYPKDISSEICQVCNIAHGSSGDTGHWIGCDLKEGCDYWVHAECLGFHASNKVLKSIKYFCPVHNTVEQRQSSLSAENS